MFVPLPCSCTVLQLGQCWLGFHPIWTSQFIESLPESQPGQVSQSIYEFLLLKLFSEWAFFFPLSQKKLPALCSQSFGRFTNQHSKVFLIYKRCFGTIICESFKIQGALIRVPRTSWNQLQPSISESTPFLPLSDITIPALALQRLT